MRGKRQKYNNNHVICREHSLGISSNSYSPLEIMLIPTVLTNAFVPKRVFNILMALSAKPKPVSKPLAPICPFEMALVIL